MTLTLKMDVNELREFIGLVAELVSTSVKCSEILRHAGFEGDAEDLEDAINAIEDYLEGESGVTH